MASKDARRAVHNHQAPPELFPEGKKPWEEPGHIPIPPEVRYQNKGLKEKGFACQPLIPDLLVAKYVTVGALGNMRVLKDKYLPAIEAGDLDINAKDELGRTCLQMALWYGFAEMAALLISKGATFDTWDEDVWSPLHYAAEWDKQATVMLLLAKGDDMHKLDNNKTSPFQAATRLNCRCLDVFEAAKTPEGLAFIKAEVQKWEESGVFPGPFYGMHDGNEFSNLYKAAGQVV